MNECFAYPCPSNHACVNPYAGHYCECSDDLEYNVKGGECEDIDKCVKNIHNCDGTREICVNVVTSFECRCADGWVDNGLGTCINFNKCITGIHSCDDNAACKDTIVSYLCTCIEGYSGNGSVCTDNNECTDDLNFDCAPHSQCVNTPGSYTSARDVGYRSSDNDSPSDDSWRCVENNE